MPSSFLLFTFVHSLLSYCSICKISREKKEVKIFLIVCPAMQWIFVDNMDICCRNVVLKEKRENKGA